jgi:signal transduction histidine kinase
MTQSLFMKLSVPHFSSKTWNVLKFLAGLFVAVLILAGSYAVNVSMTSDAFGKVSEGKITLLREATFGLGPDTGTAPDGFEKVTLPHRPENKNIGFANYRLAFTVESEPTHERHLALCVPRWSSNPSVWIDGQRLMSHEQGRVDVKQLSRPAFVPLPLRLTPGEHRLDIRLRTQGGTFPGLSEIWLGPHELLANECGALQDLQVGIRLGGFMLMVFITLVSASVYASQRDRLSLGFALAASSWCLHAWVVLGWLGPMSDEAWIAWFMVTRPMTGLFGLYVAFCLIQNRHRKLEWALLGFSMLAYLALALVPIQHSESWLMGIAAILVPATLAMGFYLLWYAASKSGYLSDFAFAISMIFGVGVNALDLARAKELLPYSLLSLTHWVAPFLALSIGLLAIERLVRYLRYKKEAAWQLKQKLTEQRNQLAAYHEEIQTQREKILLTEERQRLVRDMHDGLGSQLISASALIKSGPIQDTRSAELAALIDHALLDLRSMLDVFSSPRAVDPDDTQDTVSLLLAMLRHRLAPVFRSQGIQFAWQTEDLPHAFLSSDQDRLQLLRLLQEACTNIIKHAKAKSVTMRTLVSESVIVFEVQDDGQGLEAANAESLKRPGHGMANMADRAARLGAELVVESSPEGTGVRVIFQR